MSLACSRSGPIRTAINLAATIAVPLFVITPAHADISTTGDTNPTYNGLDDPWNIGASLQIGNILDGSMTIDDASIVNSSGGSIGTSPASTGTVTVTGNNAQWNSAGNLFIGNGGIGTLNIQQGGVVTNSFDSAIGELASGDGNATIIGTGSQWISNGNLFVGTAGTGTFSIKAGGLVSNFIGIIGFESGAQGTTTVTNTGSQWNSNDDLIVGYSGTGTLHIEAGGVVTNTDGFVGREVDATGTAIVTGAGSQWNSTNNLLVGRNGNGTLSIENGGMVNSNFSVLGEFIAATGTVTVTGAGSQWNNNGDLLVGREGIGTISIEDGGVVNNTWGVLGIVEGSMGTAIVTGAGSQWNNNGRLRVGVLGTGTVTQSNGTVSTQNGDLILGELATGNGTYDLQGGTLDLGGGNLTAGAGTATFNFNGGTLLNAHTISFDIKQNGGTLAPGGSAGETTIHGAYTLGSAATLEIELSGDPRTAVAGVDFDRLNVAGTAELTGALDVRVLGGYTAVAGDAFDVLVAESLSFNGLSLTGRAMFRPVLIDGGGAADDILRLVAVDVLGDLNGDTFVGVEDLDILLENWGDSVTNGDILSGDVIGDGVINQSDLAVVLSNWGRGTAPGGIVPEPGTLAVLGLGGLALLRRRGL